MFKYLAEEIAFFLIKNKILDIEDREIYVYGLESILLNGITVVTMFILSALTKEMTHFIGFVLFFIPLRVFVGGYHSKKSETCYLMSTSFYLITLILIHFCSQISLYQWVVACTILMALLITLMSPVVNPKHPLTDHQLKRNSKIIKVIVMLDLASLILFCKFNTKLASSEIIFISMIFILVAVSRLKDILTGHSHKVTV